MPFPEAIVQEDGQSLFNTVASFLIHSSHRGLPDVSRAARYVLKEYVAGGLLWCAAPPGHSWTADELKGFV